MKKITLLMFALVAFTWQSYAQFSESFETEIPSSWTVIDNDGQGNTWEFSDTPVGGAQLGSGVASITYESNAHDDYLITPQIAVTTGVSDRISFYVRSRSATFIESYEVLLSTATNAVVDFTEVLQADTDAPVTWTQIVLDLSSYAGQSVYVAVRATGTDEFNLYVDNFVNDTPPSCPPVTDLNATNITDSSALLAWTAGGSEALWDIEIVDITAGGTVTGTPTASDVTNPYSVMSLAAANDYEYYVRANCGGGDLSTWAGPFAFTTACSVFTPEYNANMSTNVPNCWEEANSGDITTGPQDLGAGLWFASNHNGTPSNVINLFTNTRSDWIISPIFDLSSAAPSELRVYVALTESLTSGSGADLGSDDSVDLLMTTDGGTTWTSLQSWTQGNVPTDVGEEIVYDLSAVTGNVQFAFLGDEGSVNDTEDIYFHVSKFQVRETPACLEPTALTANATSTTEALITWTAGDSETIWNYEYGVTGFTQGSGTAGTVNTTPSLSLSSLTEGETYDIYIQADCGGDTSIFIMVTWTQPSQGQICETAIMVNALPYNTTDDTANFGDDYSGSAGANGCGTTSAYLNGDDVVYAYTAAADGTINIAMSAIGSTYSGVFVYTDCASIGTECVAGFGNGSSTNDYDFNVDVTNGTTYYIVISTWASPQSTTYTLDITEVLCSDPTGLSVSNITETTAEFSWTDGGSPNAEYAIVPAGSGEPASGTAITADTYSASSLTASTSYDFYVRSDCGGGQYSNWIMVNFFTGYCIPDAGTSNLTYVDTFTTTNGGQNIDNTASGFATDNYADNFSTMTVSAPQDGSFDFNVEIVGGTAGCAIWVDWNNDFVFEASEAVFSTTSYGNGPFTGTVTVPNTVANGDYRMRVMLDWNDSNPGDDSACALASGRGEIEDYKLTVDSSLSIADVEATAFKYYPNPVNNVLTINAQNTIQNVAVYNMLGQEVLRSTPNTMTQNVDMSTLEAGAYFVQVTINDTAKTIKILKK